MIIAVPGVGKVQVEDKDKDKFLAFLKRKEEANKPSMKDLQGLVQSIASEFTKALVDRDKEVMKLVPTEVRVKDVEKLAEGMAENLVSRLSEAILAGNQAVLAQIPKEITLPELPAPVVQKSDVEPVKSITVTDIKRDWRGLIEGVKLEVER